MSSFEFHGFREYLCPHCGAILNNQDGFDPEADSWTCTSCGQELYGDDVNEGIIFPGVMWYCDDCGALLNKQKGFYDYCGTWFCSECGHLNNITEDEIYNSKEEYEEQRNASSWSNDDDDDEDDNDKDDNEKNESYSYGHSYSGHSSYTPPINSINSKNSIHDPAGGNELDIKRYLKMLLGFAFLYLVFSGWTAYKYANTPISSKNCIGKNYEIVAQQFKDAGFRNIETIPVEDLRDGWLFKDTDKVDTIQSISIKGETGFAKGEKYDKSAPVTIYYHIYPLTNN